MSFPTIESGSFWLQSKIFNHKKASYFVISRDIISGSGNNFIYFLEVQFWLVTRPRQKVGESILYFLLFIGFLFLLYPYLESEESCNIKDLVVRSQIHSGEKRPIWKAEGRKNRGFSRLESQSTWPKALPFPPYSQTTTIHLDFVTLCWTKNH